MDYIDGEDKIQEIFDSVDENHDEVKMFLKPKWVGKIHGVGVYATHSVRIFHQK